MTATSVQNANGAITFPFEVAYPVIQYADDVWAVAGATVLEPTPAAVLASGSFSDSGTYTDKLINGCMSSAIALGNQGGTGANPSLTLQAWDARVGGSATEILFDNGLQASFPRTGTQILAKAKSTPSPANDGRDNLSDLALLYMVPTLPAAGSFRMWNPADAPVFNVSDLDLSVIPLVALPSGASLPTVSAVLAKLGPINLFMRQNLFMRGVNATNQQSQYGADIAGDVATAMHFVTCSAASADDRLKVVKWLVAHGILIAYACESGCRWSSATYSFGGGHNWIKGLVVFAARLLHNAANVTARGIMAKWADQAQQRVFGDDMMIKPVAREDVELVGGGTINTRMAAIGFLNSMENSMMWNSKPSGDQGSYPYSMAYQGFNSFPWLSIAQVIRQIGGEATWGNPQFFEWCDFWFNRWIARGSPGESYFTAFNQKFVEAYYAASSHTYTATGDAPATVRLVVRDTEAWIECDENLDIRYVPDFSAFTLLKNGSPVTLANNTTTCSGATSSGSTNTQYPTISVVSATGLAVGKRIVNATLPVETRVVSVVGTTIGISSLVPSTISNQAVTISPVAVYGRSCCIIMPTAAVPGDTFTLAYDASSAGAVSLRNLRGVNLPSFTATAMLNKTGELPAAAPTRELAYSGPTQATRQYLVAKSPSSQLIKRLQISLRYWLESKSANDTILSSSTGGTPNFRFYFSTATDLRCLIGGQSFRMPGDGTALPLNTEITTHLLFDFTATTYATIYRGVHRWNGSERVAAITGSTGALDGSLNPDIATIFGSVPETGIAFGAIGNGSSAMDGAISQVAIRWGDNTLSQPADFSGSQFAYNADWGGNGENLHGVAPQRFYSLTIAEANSKVINRGSGGAAAMTPRRIDTLTEDLVTYYVAAT